MGATFHIELPGKSVGDLFESDLRNEDRPWTLLRLRGDPKNVRDSQLRKADRLSIALVPHLTLNTTLWYDFTIRISSGQETSTTNCQESQSPSQAEFDLEPLGRQRDIESRGSTQIIFYCCYNVTTALPTVLPDSIWLWASAI